MRQTITLALGAALMVAGTAASAQLRQPMPPEHAEVRPQDRPWYKSPWNPANVKPCDRQCLVDIAEAYLHALETKDMSAVPFAEQVIATENTGQIKMGTGLFWRAPVRQTPFKIILADPVYGQVAVQSVLNVNGRPAMTAIRLHVERRMIDEAEHLYDSSVDPESMELLQRPRPALLADVPEGQRASREELIGIAHSYFDALTSEDGSVAAFADDCVRHEQGYRTVNNEGPGRASPSPVLPDPNTEMGRFFIELSQMTCKEQVDTGVFNGMKRIWPRRVLVVDEQKGLVGTFPFFIHDGTRRPLPDGAPERPGNPIGMVLNLYTMETFGIRDGKIHEVEAFPFVEVPYGRNDGWTHPDLE